MNTVDALKKLYKTMAGNDWPYDPNPTDAEVIDKIAADASGSGGSGGLGRIIDLTTLEHRKEVSEDDVIHYFSGYEAGLSASDFINAWLKTAGGVLVPILKIEQGMNVSAFSLQFDESIKPTSVLDYIPETGEFSYVQQGGEGGGGGK